MYVLNGYQLSPFFKVERTSNNCDFGSISQAGFVCRASKIRTRLEWNCRSLQEYRRTTRASHRASPSRRCLRFCRRPAAAKRRVGSSECVGLFDKFFHTGLWSLECPGDFRTWQVKKGFCHKKPAYGEEAYSNHSETTFPLPLKSSSFSF